MRPRALTSAAPGRLVSLCVVVAALLLGACGFHLRGAAPLPVEMSVIYIQGTSEFDSLYEAFHTALESHGARVTQDRGEATAVLSILENHTGTDVLTVDLGGKALEYRIYQSINFEVAAADGHTLVDKQSVTQSRVIKFNSKTLLSSEREWELIQSEVRRDVANLAMLRIVAAGRR